MSKRPRQEIVRAVRRVQVEEQVSLADLARYAMTHVDELKHGVGPLSLQRWILEGKRGCFLDAIHTSTGWVSSVPALTRFLRELSEKREPATGQVFDG